MYEVIFDEKSIEFLRRLPKSNRKRIFETIRKPNRILINILSLFVETWDIVLLQVKSELLLT